jgi:hypothetical protein
VSGSLATAAVGQGARSHGAFRRSFEDATVVDIVIKGHRAAARFSNGEVVRFWGDGGTWLVHKIGEDAGRGFFE